MEETMNKAVDIKAINEKIEKESAFVDLLTLEINKLIIGQKEMVERLLIGLLGRGHILLEGVPGLAKTLAINTLSQAVKGQFSRIQFTPDLLPADVIGTMIYNVKENDFTIKKGPVFANFVLADEINRAPAKVQSALLEAMQEKQVTIGDTTFKLPAPFLVMATQNPVEQEGTYPLPEAQVDRFMLKTIIDYPQLQEEQLIVRSNLNNVKEKVKAVVTTKQIEIAQTTVREIYMDDKIEKYILDLVFATRFPERYNLTSIKPLISFGASPRGSINLATAAKCHAFLKHRGYVIPRATIDFAYSLNFPFSKLTFGLKGGLNELEVDYSKLNIADENDPYVVYNSNKLKPRIGLGIYFNTENYYLGFSAPNILETKYYDEFEIENSSFSVVSDKIHYFAMAGYVFDLTQNIKVKPATLMKIVEGAPIQWDLSLNLLFNYKTTLGIANRLDSAVCLLAGFQLSDSFFLGLSYDYMTNELRSFNSGSYEIILKFRLFSDDGKILTPRFF
jgi:MoxR-like ATPase